MGCRIGFGVQGDTFLEALSRRWDGARVAAISTTGFQDGGRQSKFASQGTASFPGMRDFRFTNHQQRGAPPRDFEKLAVWNDLKRLPSVSEHSPHVKVALRRVLIKRTPEPVDICVLHNPSQRPRTKAARGSEPWHSLRRRARDAISRRLQYPVAVSSSSPRGDIDSE